MNIKTPLAIAFGLAGGIILGEAEFKLQDTIPFHPGPSITLYRVALTGLVAYFVGKKVMPKNVTALTTSAVIGTLGNFMFSRR